MKRQRLDLLLVAAGLAESREKAQRLIIAGEVLVDDRPAAKPGHEYPVDATLRIRHPEPFVSRGGFKLQGAFDTFPGLCADGKICVDVGASTGGFTDCLLQHGAAHVYAVDVGHGLLHPRVAADPRVTVLDGVNARAMTPETLGLAPDAPPSGRPALAVTDCSFISLKLILPAIARTIAPGAQVVALIKPQFEAGRDQVGKGGVVRDPAIRQQVVADVQAMAADTLHWTLLGTATSPIRGPAGNIEFLSYWQAP